MSQSNAPARAELGRRAWPRLVRSWPYRISLGCLLLALLLSLWRPAVPTPEALAAAGSHLAEAYPGRVFAEPRMTQWPFGRSTLVYGTDREGTPARAIVNLAHRNGQTVVASSQLVAGGVDGVLLARWSLTLAAICGLVYLVFFVSIPRTFGRRCPRDLTVLKTTERVVVPGRVHTAGIGLAPIIERSYACRFCDFRHCEAVVQPRYALSASLPHLSVETVNEWRTRPALTNEEYGRALAEAKSAARARSSDDSPWLHRF